MLDLEFAHYVWSKCASNMQFCTSINFCQYFKNTSIVSAKTFLKKSGIGESKNYFCRPPLIEALTFAIFVLAENVWPDLFNWSFCETVLPPWKSHSLTLKMSTQKSFYLLPPSWLLSVSKLTASHRIESITTLHNVMNSLEYWMTKFRLL